MLPVPCEEFGNQLWLFCWKGTSARDLVGHHPRGWRNMDPVYRVGGVDFFFVTYIRKALQSAQIRLMKKLGSSDVRQTPNLCICCPKL